MLPPTETNTTASCPGWVVEVEAGVLVVVGATVVGAVVFPPELEQPAASAATTAPIATARAQARADVARRGWVMCR